MRNDQPNISVVSPIYGCRDCLKKLVAQVRDSFEGQNLTWELILVDDCGPDQPWDLILELAENDPRVRGIRLARNHGQHLAIWAGLEAAKGSWVAVIDCDLQDDPSVIPTLYAQGVETKVDAVIVERGAWSDSKIRRFLSRSFYKVVEALGGLQLKNIGNFGLYSKRMVDTLIGFKEQEVFLPMMVMLTGLRRGYYQLDRSGRAAGNSSYNLKTLFKMAVSIIIRFSDRPLKLSILVGFAFSSISVVVSITLLLAWLTGAFTVPGWTSIILSLWFLAGLILAVLGVHGFYLGRVFAEVRQRPRILIEDTSPIVQLATEQTIEKTS